MFIWICLKGECKSKCQPLQNRIQTKEKQENKEIQCGNKNAVLMSDVLLIQLLLLLLVVFVLNSMKTF